jgi:flagellar P-ring protein precursor FlgI
MINLHTPDFTTALRLVESVEASFGGGVARAVDPASVAVRVPVDATARIEFLSKVENLTLAPGESAAKVVVNSRTGTIVIGAHVKVLPAAVAHGSLTVTIEERHDVSQPNALGAGETTVTARSSVAAMQEGSRMFLFEGGASLDEIVRAVNAVGAAPGDLIAILEALKQAGALRAELEII